MMAGVRRMVSDQPVIPPAEAPYPGTAPIGAPPVAKSSRLIVIVAIVAVVAVLIVAVALATSNAQGKGQSIKNGDYIKWQLSGNSNGQTVSGVVTLTFSEVGSSTCRMSYTSDSAFYDDNSGVFAYHTTNGVWTSNGLTGLALEDASYFKGSSSSSTVFGSKTLDHYQFAYGELSLDYWVAHGSGMPYKMTVTGPAGEIIMTISDTNVDWIKKL